MANLTFDKERISLNLARLKKSGVIFEVVIDADMAIDYKKGKDIDITDVLKSEEIFFDAKKGEIASEKKMQEIFEISDNLKVASMIIKEGDIQLTAEYRQKLRDEKKKRILEIIHTNGVDPRSNLPHPLTRLENAFAEAKVHVDELLSAEDQVQRILDKLRPILPIKFEKKKLELHIPVIHAPKCYPLVKSQSNMLKDEWMNDGSWKCTIEIAAGLVEELFEKLNKITHGDMETKEIR